MWTFNSMNNRFSLSLPIFSKIDQKIHLKKVGHFVVVVVCSPIFWFMSNIRMPHQMAYLSVDCVLRISVAIWALIRKKKKKKKLPVVTNKRTNQKNFAYPTRTWNVIWSYHFAYFYILFVAIKLYNTEEVRFDPFFSVDPKRSKENILFFACILFSYGWDLSNQLGKMHFYSNRHESHMRWICASILEPYRRKI